MIIYEDDCCGCPPEMGCLGNACPKRNVLQRVCDTCGEYADYHVDGDDYCTDHLEEYLDNSLRDMGMDPEQTESIYTKAAILGANVEAIY